MKEIKSRPYKIPKIIHYCWFGDKPLPSLAIHCLESWKKYCPDYQIIQWNEKNFDINSSLYTAQAYKAKKFAFVSDYVRLWALYYYGGIYVDTDLEIIKNIDEFLYYDFFSGFESNTHVPTAIMGAKKSHHLIEELLNDYDKDSFIKNNKFDLTPNTQRITNYLIKKYNLIINNKNQVLGGDIYLFSNDYFSPKDITGIHLTDNSYTIHHFSGSWLSPRTKITKNIKENIAKFIGQDSYYKLKQLKQRFFNIFK